MEKTLNKTNKKKPKFVRQDYTKKKALGAKWRRTKGLHSKIRERRAGHEKRASIGYGSPKKTRHLDSSGLRKVLISMKQKRSNSFDDQDAVNEQIELSPHLKVGKLSDRFYTIGLYRTEKDWEPGEDIRVPNNIILHHANWTKGVENKLFLMQLVRDKVANKKFTKTILLNKWIKFFNFFNCSFH